MNWKTFFIRLAGLVAIVVGGMFLFALTSNVLILMNVMTTEANGSLFGQVLARNTMYVLLGSTVVAFASIFIKDSWRKVLYFSPLYATPLFTIIYTLMHR